MARRVQARHCTVLGRGIILATRSVLVTQQTHIHESAIAHSNMTHTRDGATRFKYEEAEFFLRHLEKLRYEDVRHMLRRSRKRRAFHFYLSAFLSAARSVTWIMRSEYIHRPGWEVWFDAQRCAGNEQLLRLFNQLRIRSEKVEPVIPGRSFRVDGDGGPPVERDPLLPRLRLEISSANPDSDGVPLLSGEVLSLSWTIDEFDGEDLLAACRRYLDLLGRLLDECQSRFA
jgi:hypothetical protein